MPPELSLKWKFHFEPLFWRRPAFFFFAKGVATSYTTSMLSLVGRAGAAAESLPGVRHCPAGAVFFAAGSWRSGEVVVAIRDEWRQ